MSRSFIFWFDCHHLRWQCWTRQDRIVSDTHRICEWAWNLTFTMTRIWTLSFWDYMEKKSVRTMMVVFFCHRPWYDLIEIWCQSLQYVIMFARNEIRKDWGMMFIIIIRTRSRLESFKRRQFLPLKIIIWSSSDRACAKLSRNLVTKKKKRTLRHILVSIFPFHFRLLSSIVIIYRTLSTFGDSARKRQVKTLCDFINTITLLFSNVVLDNNMLRIRFENF